MEIEPTITRVPLSENAVFEKSKFDISPTSVSELSKLSNLKSNLNLNFFWKTNFVEKFFNE
jgi:hypothetical protein